jgi:hypothetical protein
MSSLIACPQIGSMLIPLREKKRNCKCFIHHGRATPPIGILLWPMAMRKDIFTYKT